MIEYALKRLAIVLYVLAVRNAQHACVKRAQFWGILCQRTLQRTRTDTLQQCATARVRLWKVFIPELLHEGVVQTNMSYYGIVL